MERPGGTLIGTPVRRGPNLLDKLAPEDRERLSALGRSRVVEAGAELVRQGSAGDCLFILEEGELAVVRSLPGDEEKLLLRAHPGMILGEMAVLDGGARAASLRAVRRSVVRVVGVGAFEAITLHGGETGHRILRAVTALVHERLGTTCGAGECRMLRAGEGTALEWGPADARVADLLEVFSAFAAFDRPDRAALLPHIRAATVARGADLVLPEAHAPGVTLVLRGALSPWLEDDGGPQVALPAAGPGRFVDYAAALGFGAAPRRWRVRSPTRLLRLDPALFEAGAPSSAPLLYALSRDLATTLRRATGLTMHFDMAWARQAPRPAAPPRLAVRKA